MIHRFFSFSKIIRVYKHSYQEIWSYKWQKKICIFIHAALKLISCVNFSSWRPDGKTCFTFSSTHINVCGQFTELEKNLGCLYHSLLTCLQTASFCLAVHCSFIPVTWSVVHHRAGSWEGFFFPLFWIRTLVVQGKAGTLPLSALTKPSHTHLHYVNRLFAVCSSFHLRSWINIAICAPFCLLKNTFLMLYWG